MKGAIWYQGESNRVAPEMYLSLFSTMISSWREQWQQGPFPFYYVQIAPFRYGGHDDLSAPLVREAQLQTMKAVPNAGMAVTADIGECLNIHPAEKQLVGERLALWALANDYSIPGITYSGPLYKAMELTDDNGIRITFDHLAQGLSFFDNEPEGFEIAGEDHVFHPATAIINRDKSLTIKAEEVNKPVAVRYAFRSCVKGTLYNTAGLPASPFRTDNWE
jgi:sialate O-acetylesterase